MRDCLSRPLHPHLDVCATVYLDLLTRTLRLWSTFLVEDSPRAATEPTSPGGWSLSRTSLWSSSSTGWAPWAGSALEMISCQVSPVRREVRGDDGKRSRGPVLCQLIVCHAHHKSELFFTWQPPSWYFSIPRPPSLSLSSHWIFVALSLASNHQHEFPIEWNFRLFTFSTSFMYLSRQLSGNNNKWSGVTLALSLTLAV